MTLNFQKSLMSVALLAATVAAAPSVAAPLPTCVIDQYGNRYEYTVDATNTFVYGTMTDAQGCASSSWPLTGSFVKKNGVRILELTAANPTPSSCVATFKLKGGFPNFAWYYDSGYGAQESTYVTCSAAQAGVVEPSGPGRGSQR